MDGLTTNPAFGTMTCVFEQPFNDLNEAAGTEVSGP